MADEPEVIEKSPYGRDAQREAAGPEDLADHQHADVLVLLLDQVPTEGCENADDWQRGEDRDQIYERLRDKLVLEPVHRGKKECDVKQAQPNDAPVVAFPGRSADHVHFLMFDQAPCRPRERTAMNALAPCITTHMKGIQ